MSFPLTPANGDFAIVNGIKYQYYFATNSWRRDFNNVLDRLFLVGYNQATNTGTGDLVVFGGGSFGKNLWVGEDLHVLGNIYGDLIGVITTASLAISVQGGAPGSILYQTNTSTTGFVSIGNTGSLLVSNGVIPIWTTTAAISVNYANSATNLVGGGPWQIPFQSNTGTTTFNPLFQYDNTKLLISNTTTSLNSSTGALVVLGGAGFVTDVNIGRNLTVSGNFTVNGTTTWVNSTNLDVTDKNITIAKGATTATMADGAGLTIEGPTVPVQWVYNAGTDRWVSNRLVEIPNGYVNSGVNSTATTNGALVVRGGIGVSADVVADEFFGRFTGPIGLATKNGGNFTGLSANDIVNFTSNQNAVSTASGAVRIVGGVGIGQDLYVGGQIYGYVTTATFATTAGVANTATTADYATTASCIGGGLAGEIPYQFAPGITTFSANLKFISASNEFQTVNIKANKIRVEVTSTTYTEGLELININTLGNKSPLFRLSTASNSIIFVNDASTLKIYNNTTTDSLFSLNSTSLTIAPRTLINNTLTVGGDILPDFFDLYDIGKQDNAWRNVYANTATIDYEVRVGDVSIDNYSRFIHYKNPTGNFTVYGIPVEFGQATIITNEESTWNQAIVLGDTGSSSATHSLFGIATADNTLGAYTTPSTGLESTWQQRLILFGNGILKVPTGGIQLNGNLTPLTNNLYDIGFSTATWRNLFVSSATITTATITTANITTATAITLRSTTATITTVNATSATVTTLESTTATITKLTSDIGAVTTLESTTATITTVNATSATVTTLESTTATITTVNATTATIDTINANIGIIKTSVNNSQIKTASTGTVNHDLALGTTFFHASIADNFTANFTNMPAIDSGTVVVDLYLLQDGVSSRFASNVTINGTAVAGVNFGSTAQHGIYTTGFHRQRITLLISGVTKVALIDYEAYLPIT